MIINALIRQFLKEDRFTSLKKLSYARMHRPLQETREIPVGDERQVLLLNDVMATRSQFS